MFQYLYLVRRTDTVDYDEHGDLLVCANDREQVRYLMWKHRSDITDRGLIGYSSADGKPENFTVRCLGTASAHVDKGVLIEAFRYG